MKKILKAEIREILEELRFSQLINVTEALSCIGEAVDRDRENAKKLRQRARAARRKLLRRP